MMGSYLPPEDTLMVRSLWTVLTDPQKYKDLFDQLDAKDKAAAESKSQINDLMQEYSAKKSDLEARERALQEAQKESEDQKLSLHNREQDLADKMSRHAFDSTQLMDAHASKAKELEKREQAVTAREKYVSARELDLEAAKSDHEKRSAELDRLKADYHAKVDKLKFIVGVHD